MKRRLKNFAAKLGVETFNLLQLLMLLVVVFFCLLLVIISPHLPLVFAHSPSREVTTMPEDEEEDGEKKDGVQLLSISQLSKRFHRSTASLSRFGKVKHSH